MYIHAYKIISWKSFDWQKKSNSVRRRKESTPPPLKNQMVRSLVASCKRSFNLLASELFSYQIIQNLEIIVMQNSYCDHRNFDMQCKFGNESRLDLRQVTSRMEHFSIWSSRVSSFTQVS
jgi:hypothetical protein